MTRPLMAVWLLSAAAAGGATIDFSDLSSDDTDPGVLNARWEFSVYGDEFSLLVTNLTSEPNAYTVSEFYFNIVGDVGLLDLDVVDDAGFDHLSFRVDEALPGDDNQSGYKAARFGRFDVRLDLGRGNAGIAPGDSALFVFSGFEGFSDDLLNELSENPPGDASAIAVTKFTKGPNDDSAFGSSGGVPEPSTLALLGLLPLTTWLRRGSSTKIR